ncbi:porin [Paraburkholderia sediminicola]|nr:porin [Paraburkholderia sediminicola]
MKKVGIAFTAVGVLASTGACAQSSVTLYGILDTNIEFATNVGGAGGGGNRVSMSTTGGPTGSRWGLTGVENLGGGIDAIFTLENGFAVNTGAAQQGGRMFGRQAFVGFRSEQYGKLTVGRQYTTMFDKLAEFTPLQYGTTYEPGLFLWGTDVRNDNSIKYSGVFGSVSVEAHWSFGNGVAGNEGQIPGQFHRDTGYGAGMNYRLGAFNAALVYDQANPSLLQGNGTFLGTGTTKKAAVALTYATKSITVFGGYRWAQNKDQVKQTVYRDNFYWTGLDYFVTPSFVLEAGYYYANIIVNPGGTPNPWQASIYADYFLSKRTDVYLGVGYSKKAGLNFDGSYPLEPGKNSMVAVALGLRTKF